MEDDVLVMNVEEDDIQILVGGGGMDGKREARILVKCQVCKDTCTRAVSVACCDGLACRACAVKHIGLSRNCWSCSKPMNNEDLQNDDNVRYIVKLIKDGKCPSKADLDKIRKKSPTAGTSYSNPNPVIATEHDLPDQDKSSTSDKKCHHCKQTGHFIRDCPDLICSNCKQKGHTGDKCNASLCSKCNEYGHKSNNCFVDTACKYCKGKKRKTHSSKDCRDKPIIKCQGCKKPGHNEDMCPKALCMNCKETGHYQDKCPKVICLSCQEVGHAKARCPKREEYCVSCEMYGHSLKNCLEESNLQTACARCDAGDCDLKRCPRYNPSQKCLNCNQPGHFIKNCPVKDTRDCNLCGELGHIAKVCPNKDKIKCNNCGIKGHNAMSCRLVGCSFCEDLGHKSKDCPNKNKKCNNCGSIGHKANECPKPEMRECRICFEKGHLAKKCSKCFNCGFRCHIRKDCPKPDMRQCKKCFQKGHIDKKCPNSKGCSVCYDLGHISKDCPNKNKHYIRSCNICNEVGHIARKCPNKNLPGCSNCGGVGHFENECSVVQQPSLSGPLRYESRKKDFPGPDVCVAVQIISFGQAQTICQVGFTDGNSTEVVRLVLPDFVQKNPKLMVYLNAGQFDEKYGKTPHPYYRPKDEEERGMHVFGKGHSLNITLAQTLIKFLNNKQGILGFYSHHEHSIVMPILLQGLSKLTSDTNFAIIKGFYVFEAYCKSNQKEFRGIHEMLRLSESVWSAGRMVEHTMQAFNTISLRSSPILFMISDEIGKMINFPTSGIHVISNVDPLVDPSYQILGDEEVIDWKPKEDYFEDEEEIMRPGPRYDDRMDIDEDNDDSIEVIQKEIKEIEAERDRIKWETELLQRNSKSSVKRYDDGRYEEQPEMNMSCDELSRSFDDQNNLNSSFNDQTMNPTNVANPRYDDNLSAQQFRYQNEVFVDNKMQLDNISDTEGGFSRFTPMPRRLQDQRSPARYNPQPGDQKKSIPYSGRFSPQPGTSHGHQRRTSSPKGRFSPQPSSSKGGQNLTIPKKDKFSPQPTSGKLDQNKTVPLKGKFFSPDLVCGSCNGKGHEADNCLKFFCLHCNKNGHLKKDCCSKDLKTKDGNNGAKDKPDKDMLDTSGNQDWQTCNNILGVLTRLSPIRNTAWKLLENEISKDPSFAMKWISSLSDTKISNKFVFERSRHLNRVIKILSKHHPNIDLDTSKTKNDTEQIPKSVTTSLKNKNVQENNAALENDNADKGIDETKEVQDWQARKHLNGVLACLSPVQNTAWVLLELEIVKDPNIFMKWISSVNQPGDPKNFFGGLENVNRVRMMMKKHHPQIKLPELIPQVPKKSTTSKTVVEGKKSHEDIIVSDEDFSEDVILSDEDVEDSDIEVVEVKPSVSKKREKKRRKDKKKWSEQRKREQKEKTSLENQKSNKDGTGDLLDLEIFPQEKLDLEIESVAPEPVLETERISPEPTFFEKIDKQVVDTTGYDAIQSPERPDQMVFIPGLNLATSNFQILQSTSLQPQKIPKSKKAKKSKPVPSISLQPQKIPKSKKAKKSKPVCSGGKNCTGGKKFLHTSNNCRDEVVICQDCKEHGHSKNKCPKALCTNCNSLGHLSDKCSSVGPLCSKCKLRGHSKDNCTSTFCNNCSNYGHKSKNCYFKICGGCKVPGHDMDKCPNKSISCYNCSNYGHKTKNCFVKTCDGCKEPGHNMDKCPNKKALCMKCNGKGHFSDKCALIKLNKFLQQPSGQKPFEDAGARRYDQVSQEQYGDQGQSYHLQGPREQPNYDEHALNVANQVMNMLNKEDMYEVNKATDRVELLKAEKDRIQFEKDLLQRSISLDNNRGFSRSGHMIEEVPSTHQMTDRLPRRNPMMGGLPRGHPVVHEFQGGHIINQEIQRGHIENQTRGNIQRDTYMREDLQSNQMGKEMQGAPYMIGDDHRGPPGQQMLRDNERGQQNRVHHFSGETLSESQHRGKELGQPEMDLQEYYSEKYIVGRLNDHQSQVSAQASVNREPQNEEQDNRSYHSRKSLESLSQEEANRQFNQSSGHIYQEQVNMHPNVGNQPVMRPVIDLRKPDVDMRQRSDMQQEQEADNQSMIHKSDEVPMFGKSINPRDRSVGSQYEDNLSIRQFDNQSVHSSHADVDGIPMAGYSQNDSIYRGNHQPARSNMETVHSIRDFRNLKDEDDPLEMHRRLRSRTKSRSPSNERHSNNRSQSGQMADQGDQRRYPKNQRDERRGPRDDPRGPRDDPRDHRDDPRGQRGDSRGPRDDLKIAMDDPRGPRNDSRGPRDDPKGQRGNSRGQRGDSRGARDDLRGPRGDSRGPRGDSRGPRDYPRDPRDDIRGPRDDQRIPRDDPRGSQNDLRGPRDDPRGQKDDNRGQRGEPLVQRDGQVGQLFYSNDDPRSKGSIHYSADEQGQYIDQYASINTPQNIEGQKYTGEDETLTDFDRQCLEWDLANTDMVQKNDRLPQSQNDLRSRSPSREGSKAGVRPSVMERIPRSDSMERQGGGKQRLSSTRGGGQRSPLPRGRKQMSPLPRGARQRSDSQDRLMQERPRSNREDRPMHERHRSQSKDRQGRSRSHNRDRSMQGRVRSRSDSRDRPIQRRQRSNSRGRPNQRRLKSQSGDRTMRGRQRTNSRERSKEVRHRSNSRGKPIAQGRHKLRSSSRERSNNWKGKGRQAIINSYGEKTSKREHSEGSRGRSFSRSPEQKRRKTSSGQVYDPAQSPTPSNSSNDSVQFERVKPPPPPSLRAPLQYPQNSGSNPSSSQQPQSVINLSVPPPALAQPPSSVTPATSYLPSNEAYLQAGSAYPQSANSAYLQASTSYPSNATAYPQTATAYPPAVTAYPQTATAYPPTATALPQTATAYPSAATAYPQAATAYSQSYHPTTAAPQQGLTVYDPATATYYHQTASYPPATSAYHYPATAASYPPTAVQPPPYTAASSHGQQGQAAPTKKSSYLDSMRIE